MCIEGRGQPKVKNGCTILFSEVSRSERFADRRMAACREIRSNCSSCPPERLLGRRLPGEVLRPWTILKWWRERGRKHLAYLVLKLCYLLSSISPPLRFTLTGWVLLSLPRRLSLASLPLTPLKWLTGYSNLPVQRSQSYLGDAYTLHATGNSSWQRTKRKKWWGTVTCTH